MKTPSLHSTLDDYLAVILESHPLPETVASSAVMDIILGLSEAAIQIARLAASNGLSADNLGALAGGMNEDGDSQKQLDLISDALIQEALSQAGVGHYFSEEQSAPLSLHV